MAGAEARVLWQRAASKRCLLHEDVKHSHKLSHMNSDCHCEKTHLGSSKNTEEKDVTVSTDSWSILSSQCSSGRKSNIFCDLTSTVHKDYRSAMDESFMFRFSKSDEFDSLKAADVSLGSFADLQLLISGEAGSPELGYKQRSMPGQQLETSFSGSATVKHENVGEYNDEFKSLGPKKTKPESETDDTIELEKRLRSSSFQDGEWLPRTREMAITHEGSKRSETVTSVPRSQIKGKLSWRTADTVELAALVARQSIEHMENCDLPPSRSILMQEGTLEGRNSKRLCWDVSRSMDREILFSLVHGHESVPQTNQNLSFPKFLSYSDPLPAPYHVPQASNPLPDLPKKKTPSIKQEEQLSNTETQNSSSNTGKETLQESNHGPQLLGEALCHSQTRAREAEKAAAQALHEKERLARLLLREASLSLTYRQWVGALQAENMSLRLQAADRSNGKLKKKLMSSYPTTDLSSDARWRYSRKERTWKEMQRHSNVSKHKRSVGKPDVIAGYTLGLAFAFGLGLAGAGLVLGWSMGWILFAPLGN